MTNLRDESALSLLLGSFSKDRFFDEVFEKRPQVFEKALKGRIDDLFGGDDLDRLFADYDLRFPIVEMLEHGRPTRPPEFKSVAVDRERFLESVRNGASVRIREIQMLVPEVMTTAKRLSEELSGFVNVNAYLTPAGSKALKPHYDDQDVFVVQCLGEKRWIINETYRDQTPLPNARLKRGESHIRESDSATAQEVVLRDGDVLYLPRGTLHAASASSRGSCHITLGYTPITWAHVCHLAIDQAERNDISLRRVADPCLFGARVEGTGAFVMEFQRLMSTIDIGAAVNAARAELRTAFPGPSARLSSIVT